MFPCSSRNTPRFRLVLIPSLLLLLLLLHLDRSSGERLSNRSYYTLPQTSYAVCVRRFNGTHQVGCSSKMGGNVGRLLFVDTPAELANLTPSDTADTVLAVPASLFASHTAQLHSLPGGLQGLLVLYPETERGASVSMSEDSTCPNDRLSAYRGNRGGNCAGSHSSPTAWNVNGTSAALLDWPFPVALLAKSEQISTMKNCTRQQSSLRHCAVELRTPMHGAASSVACLRRPHYTALITALTSITQLSHFCGPMGDYSLLWTARSNTLPTNAVRPQKSVLLIMARLDSFSMFARHSPASSTLNPALTIMLALANALAGLASRLHDNATNTQRDVALVFVNSDSWDYIGSQRLVYDLHGNRLFGASGQPAKINASHIHSIIELGQLANLESIDQLMAYTDPYVYPMVEYVVNSSLSGLGLKPDALISDRKLPPASTQTFLRPPGSNPSAQLQQIPALLLADHRRDTGLLNPNYHSFADLKPVRASVTNALADLANRLASYAAAFLTNQTEISPPVTIDRRRMESYANCLQSNATCDQAIFAANVSKAWLEKVYSANINGIIGSYIYEYQSRFLPSLGGNQLRYLTYLLLSNATGQLVDNVHSKQDCLALNSANVTTLANLPIFYDWTSGSAAANITGACLRLSVTALPAVSPISDSDYDSWNGSGDYATWTESQWDTPSVRLFMRPSTAWGIAHLMFGLAVLLASVQFVLGARHGLEANFPSSMAH